jgi:hypothetical protein
LFGENDLGRVPSVIRVLVVPRLAAPAVPLGFSCFLRSDPVRSDSFLGSSAHLESMLGVDINPSLAPADPIAHQHRVVPLHERAPFVFCY